MDLPTIDFGSDQLTRECALTGAIGIASACAEGHISIGKIFRGNHLRDFQEENCPRCIL
jgi:hypothetical protein